MPDLTPSQVFSELVTTTLRNRSKELTDNMSKHNALYKAMAEGDKVRKESGGVSITQELDYANNSTYQRYSGYDTLNVGGSQTLSAAEFPWKQVAISVVASGEELRKNSGKERMINLVKARITNAERTFRNNFSSDLYGDGSLPNQIMGLQGMVANNGLGTIGNIDSSAWAFWRNQVQSAAAPLQGGAAIVPSADTIQSLMLPLWMSLTRGSDAPNLLLADTNYFQMYEQSLTDLKRYTSSDTGKGGFLNLKYKSADVVYDNDDIQANTMYFLNTDYLGLVVHKDADMTTLEGMRPYNQDASVTTMIWMGNMVCSNRRLQGIMKA